MCMTQKKSAARVGRKAAGGSKKSSEPVGKGKKPTVGLVGDEDKDEDKEDDDAEFTE
ncbi:hypothetical protein BT96DRAFT_998311 [Gymnopus androsaceus JB14]|uniref:Uncharacterized protein n=1 Tax=Gymnopus androsaceus JB14 TaxID=1447944 RepID=A0A6A4HAP4_9AGAR|nr:hypothetical protein BT96DRAFT_998311 [Gymnopus androsaceus JB14]